jgi:hypothetical protein
MTGVPTGRTPDLVPICPLCRTFDQTVTRALLAVGGSWQCVTCGQRWNAARLNAVGKNARDERSC